VLKRVTLKSVNSAATVVGIDYRKRAPLCPVRAKWHALFIIFTERFSRVSRQPTWLAVFISAEVSLTNRVRIMHRFRSYANERLHTHIYTHLYAHMYFCDAIKQFCAFLSRKHFHSREVGTIYKTITSACMVWTWPGERAKENRKEYFHEKRSISRWEERWEISRKRERRDRQTTGKRIDQKATSVCEREREREREREKPVNKLRTHIPWDFISI